MTWKSLKKPERVALIQRHWVTGATADSIAKSINQATKSNISRHAILGLYYRNNDIKRRYPLGPEEDIGLSATKRKSNQGRRRQLATRAQIATDDPTTGLPVGPKIVLSALALAYDADTRRVPLANLRPGQCSWPVNDAQLGEKHLFCGLEATSGLPYCPHHHDRAYRRSK